MRILQTDRARRCGGVALLALVGLHLGACGSGGGSSQASVPQALPPSVCGPNERVEAGACRAFGVLENLRVDTPFTENGRAVSLEVVVVRPDAAGPYPALIFHHGSTGDGSDPSTFRLTFTSNAIAGFFVDRGWLVAFPQRRGRGQSDGLYDEGFKSDRSGYSCEQSIALAGADRALEDLDVLTGWLRSRTDVDLDRLVVAGTSRGGILAIAHAARQQDIYLGAMNFVGGWLGEGCGDYLAVNRSLFLGGSTYPRPTLWLYGANDSFYSLEHSQANFDAYVSAGGLAEFHLLVRSAGRNGHFVLNDSELWGPLVSQYLEAL